MKNLNLLVLFFSVSQIGCLSAQETEVNPVPEAGKGQVEWVDENPKKKRIGNRIVLKNDFAYAIQKGVGFEVEVPIDIKSSFIFSGGWRPLNNHIAYRQPGAYQHTYAVTDVETTSWFFGPFTTRYTIISPKPFPKNGAYLLTSLVALQVSIRDYMDDKQRNSRFFLQPGFRIFFLKRLNIRDQQILLSETTTDTSDMGSTFSGFDATHTKTTIHTYQQTRITSPGVHQTVFGFALDLGWRFQHKNRLSLDLGVRAGWNFIEKTLGMQKVYVMPMVNLGFGI